MGMVGEGVGWVGVRCKRQPTDWTRWAAESPRSVPRSNLVEKTTPSPDPRQAWWQLLPFDKALVDPNPAKPFNVCYVGALGAELDCRECAF